MDNITRLQSVLRSLNERPPSLQPAIVKSVDDKAKTCEIELVASDTEVLRARLQAVVAGSDSHFFIKPSKGRHVLAAQLAEEWIVLLSSEVGAIELRGNAFGDLIKITELTTKSNEAIDELNSNISQVRSDLNTLVSKLKAIRTQVASAAPSATQQPRAHSPCQRAAPPRQQL